MLRARKLIRRGEGNQRLLDLASISVEAGERIGIVGPTGSGKSLLLRSLALLDPLDDGEIFWYGRSLEPQRIPHFRSQVIYLHQRPALWEGTVEDNLRRPFEFREHANKAYEQPRVIELLEVLNRSESFLQKQTGNLSGGEAQLTALLRAIQLNPKILLLDEPTSALDEDSIQTVERLVQFWLEEPRGERAILWVSHSTEQIDRICSRVVRIASGRVIGEVDG